MKRFITTLSIAIAVLTTMSSCKKELSLDRQLVFFENACTISVDGAVIPGFSAQYDPQRGGMNGSIITVQYGIDDINAAYDAFYRECEKRGKKLKDKDRESNTSATFAGHNNIAGNICDYSGSINVSSISVDLTNLKLK